MNELCYILAIKVKEYFKDEQHRKDFEEWYRKKYGKEYIKQDGRKQI